MNKLLATAAIVIALASVPAGAQHALPPPPSLVGFGVVNGGCGKWLVATENSLVDIGFTSWLMGYVSSFNTVYNLDRHGDFLQGYDGSRLIPWAKGWCRQHPLDQVSGVADALIIELVRRGTQK